MSAPIAEQIALVQTHIELEEAAAFDLNAMLAAHPELGDNQDELDRCARELKIWKDILATLKRLNVH